MRFAAKSIKFSVTGRILECHSREALKRASLSNSFSLQRRKLNIKGWTGSRQSWDKSTAPLLQHSFHMDTWRAGTTKGEEKRKCITFNHSLCRGFWHLCASLHWYHSLQRRRNLLSLFTKEWTVIPRFMMREPQGWPLTKLVMKVKFTLKSLLQPIPVCFL